MQKLAAKVLAGDEITVMIFGSSIAAQSGGCTVAVESLAPICDDCCGAREFGTSSKHFNRVGKPGYSNVLVDLFQAHRPGAYIPQTSVAYFPESCESSERTT
eukprot:7137884-Pyramimonas_sp.AAC.1